MVTQQDDRAAVTRVAIVGCGRIASRWNEVESPQAGELTKTHAKAFCDNSRSEIVGFMDCSLERAQEAAMFWGTTQSSDSIAELMDQDPNLVCLCTPESARLDILLELDSKNLKTIVIEKPLAGSSDEAERIKELALDRNWHVLVNYIRRYGEGYLLLKNIIERGELGEVKRVVASYGKGLRNNGSHLLDLVSFLVGSAHSPERLQTVFDDRSDFDPTIDARLTLPNGACLYLLGSDHLDYCLFELDIFFSRGRARTIGLHEEIQISRTIVDTDYPEYVVLEPQEVLTSGTRNHFQALAEHAINLTQNGGAPDISELDTHIRNLKTIEKLGR